MQIVVTCDSYEELVAAAKQILKDPTDAPAPKPAKVTKEKAEPKKQEPVQDPEPAIDQESKPEATGDDETAVKVMLADKIKSGKKAEVRALFEEYGVAKLSELMAKCPDKLAEFSAKAEAL